MNRFAHPGFLSMFLLSSACAWDGTGHMTVAYIAYQQLTPAERKAIAAILSAHPDHARWTKGIPGDNVESTEFAMIVRSATWPDDIRSDKRFYDDTDKHQQPKPVPPGFPSLSALPAGANMIHKNWHFINEPLAGDSDALTEFDDNGDFRKPPTILIELANAESAMSNSDSGVRAYYMPWLIHLVGDVHQPLHTVAHIIDQGPDGKPIGDLGGNSVKLVLFQNQTIVKPANNLHTFWDDCLGQTTDLATITSLGDALMHLYPKNGASATVKPDTWFAESAATAISVVYKDLADAQVDDDGLTTIPAGYFDTANTVAGQRVAQAGYRLGAVLKTVAAANNGN